MNSNRLLGGTLAIAIAALVVAVAAMAFTAGRGSSYGPMMGGPARPMMNAGYGMMGGQGAGMMGGQSWWSNPSPESQPGGASFTPGTAAAPRTIRINAGPGDAFYPSSITVQRGETITFLVTTMGPAEHEFMVGPADAVAADREGTPEVSGLAMMQTKSLSYTFDGTGPYAYACHEPGHYEAGMRGTITIVG